MEPEPEILSDAPEPRHIRWGICAVVLAVLAAGVALSLDGASRHREAVAIGACETRLRLASDHADYHLGLITNYVQPVAAGTARTHLADLMAPRARRVLPAAQRADRLCRTVRVRPWHFALASRQQADTAYSGALVTLLQTVAAQGGGGFHSDLTFQRLRDAAGLAGG